jgi:hypothetical protein
VAVLARVNAMLVPVQVALRREGVATTQVSGTEFLDRTSIRAVLAWVRLATADGAWRGDDLAEAVRRPSRGLSPRLSEWVAECRSPDGLERLATRLSDPRDADKVRAFGADLERARRVAARSTTDELVRVLCDDIGLAGTLATLDLNRRGTNAPSQSDDLLAARQLAALCPEPSAFTQFLTAELSRSADPEGVVLATVHRVKGQEWPHVVVHLADVDQFPHRLAEDVTEERRIFHVALTRGGERVTVISSASRPSPFLDELDRPPSERELQAAAFGVAPGARAVTTSADERGATGGRRTGSTATGGTGASAGREAAAVRRAAGPLTGGVTAGVGLVLVDQGAEWQVTAVSDDGVDTRNAAGLLRRVRFGVAVSTLGKQRGPLRAPADVVPAAAPVVFDSLRQWRDRRRNGKPAYTIFDDATLELISLTLPADLAALARVRGVGPMKLEQYADDVLAVVADATSGG